MVVLESGASNFVNPQIQLQALSKCHVQVQVIIGNTRILQFDITKYKCCKMRTYVPSTGKVQVQYLTPGLLSVTFLHNIL